MMPNSDAALLSAEEMIDLYARQALSPVEVLEAVTGGSTGSTRGSTPSW